jgi:hypothetical protein
MGIIKTSTRYDPDCLSHPQPYVGRSVIYPVQCIRQIQMTLVVLY